MANRRNILDVDQQDNLYAERLERIDRLLRQGEALHEYVQRLFHDEFEFERQESSCDNLASDACYEENNENVCLGPEDELVKPTIRPIFTMKPGMPAYRHDPVRRFELYQKEWAKFPVPGEDKRLPLRWKVREFMLRQDEPTKMN